jgi:hypothetical protein
VRSASAFPFNLPPDHRLDQRRIEYQLENLKAANPPRWRA